MPDGTLPEPRGSSRIALLVPDLAGTIEVLHGKGVRIHTEIISGVAVRQAVLQDPAGNLIELFEPLAGYHERAPENAG
jgi:predicted enzyme related to lactoylglutathione lyase